jgi:PAS domain S-box-containing protein
MYKPLKILLVEDNPGDVDLIQEMMTNTQAACFSIATVNKLSEAIAWLKSNVVDLVLLDLGLLDSSGLDTFIKLRAVAPDMPIVILTGNTDEEASVIAVKEGAQDFLIKGQISGILLNRAIRYAVERKKAEISLRSSEEKFRQATESMRDAFVVIEGETGRVTMWNAAAEMMFGYAKDEVIGRDFHETVVPPRYRDAANVGLAHFRVTGEGPAIGKTLELQALHKNGTEFSVELAISAMRIKNKWYATGTVRDITERKLFDAALKASEERFRKVIESLTDVVFEWDTREKVEWFGNIDGIMGYPPGGFPRTIEAWAATLHPEDKDRVIAALEGQLKGVSPYVVEYRVMRRDGEWRWWAARGTVLRDDKGNPTKMVGSVTDITENKRAENELKESKALFEAVVENIPLTLFLKEASELRFVILNRAGEEFFGYDRKAFLGKSDLDFFPPEQAAFFMAKDREVLDGEAAMLDIPEEPILTAKKGQRLLHTRKVRVLGTNGVTKYLLGICEDITERKHAEIELHQAKVAAETANDAKSQFLANMSHEIRTPMNGIIGISQLLQMTELTDEQREYTKILKYSGDNLLRLISDILDISRIEAGHVVLETHDIDLSDKMAKINSMFSLLAKEKKLEFDVHINPDVPRFLIGDSERLRQIISNLVGNAIKYTNEGHISLHISKDAEDGQHITLRFEVLDSGIGIASDNIETIFEPFRQVDSSTSRKYGGTGLGLAIARHLVELMGGSLGVESREGEGTTFWFTVVLEKQTKTPDTSNLEKDEHSSSISVRKVDEIPILLVEDDEANQVAISRLLSKTGYRVDIANNGSEGLKMLEESDYALVLMDCMMPVMDGYEATAAIRSQTSNVRNHAIPVVAVTAHALREARDKCLAAGMDDYLSKPVEYSVMIAPGVRIVVASPPRFCVNLGASERGRL